MINWFVGVAHAAADPNVVNAATDLSTALEENTLAGVTAILPTLGIIMGLVIVIFLTFKFVKRSAR